MSGSVTVTKLIGPQATKEQEELCSGLLRAAGFDPQNLTIPTGGQYNDEFVMILQVLAYIGARKTDLYGDFRMQDIRSKERELWGAYWDIQRKFGRLDAQLAQDETPTNISETCGDMAVYCVRLIQIMRRLQERGML